MKKLIAIALGMFAVSAFAANPLSPVERAKAELPTLLRQVKGRPTDFTLPADGRGQEEQLHR